MRLQGTWTDGQGDSYIPPPTLFEGGIIILKFQVYLVKVIPGRRGVH